MKESGIWRIRRGKLSLTAAKGSSGAVSLKYGAIELSAIRIFSPYFAGAKFIASELEETPDGIRIYYSSEFLLPQLPAYWMPTSQPVDFNELPYNTLEKRELKPRPKLYYTIDIKDLDNVFELHIRSLQGMNAVPFIAELLFVPNGRMHIARASLGAPIHAMLRLFSLDPWTILLEKQTATLVHIGTTWGTFKNPNAQKLGCAVIW